MVNKNEIRSVLTESPRSSICSSSHDAQATEFSAFIDDVPDPTSKPDPPDPKDTAGVTYQPDCGAIFCDKEKRDNKPFTIIKVTYLANGGPLPEGADCVSGFTGILDKCKLSL